MLDLCDTCAGGTAVAFQTWYWYTVGPNVSIEALSCVDILTSALKTEWD